MAAWYTVRIAGFIIQRLNLDTPPREEGLRDVTTSMLLLFSLFVVCFDSTVEIVTHKSTDRVQHRRDDSPFRYEKKAELAEYNRTRAVKGEKSDAY